MSNVSIIIKSLFFLAAISVTILGDLDKTSDLVIFYGNLIIAILYKE